MCHGQRRSQPSIQASRQGRELPLDNLRLRATEALRALVAAQDIAVPSELKVGPVCEAMLAVRDLLLCHGDKHSLVPGDHHEAKSLAVLGVFASAEMHGLISALEIVASRSSSIVEMETGKDGQRDGHSQTKGNEAR
jgi:hypothetical protein